MAIPIDNEGYYMDARYRSQFYNKKSFEANIDVPDTEIKKGDKVAIAKVHCMGATSYSVILDKPYTDKDTGFYIDTVHNINPVNFSRIV